MMSNKQVDQLTTDVGVMFTWQTDKSFIVFEAFHRNYTQVMRTHAAKGQNTAEHDNVVCVTSYLLLFWLAARYAKLHAVKLLVFVGCALLYAALVHGLLDWTV